MTFPSSGYSAVRETRVSFAPFNHLYCLIPYSQQSAEQCQPVITFILQHESWAKLGKKKKKKKSQTCLAVIVSQSQFSHTDVRAGVKLMRQMFVKRSACATHSVS